jgi:hypothetical protein
MAEKKKIDVEALKKEEEEARLFRVSIPFFGKFDIYEDGLTPAERFADKQFKDEYGELTAKDFAAGQVKSDGSVGLCIRSWKSEYDRAKFILELDAALVGLGFAKSDDKDYGEAYRKDDGENVFFSRDYSALACSLEKATIAKIGKALARIDVAVFGTPVVLGEVLREADYVGTLYDSVVDIDRWYKSRKGIGRKASFWNHIYWFLFHGPYKRWAYEGVASGSETLSQYNMKLDRHLKAWGTVTGYQNPSAFTYIAEARSRFWFGGGSETWRLGRGLCALNADSLDPISKLFRERFRVIDAI